MRVSIFAPLLACFALSASLLCGAAEGDDPKNEKPKEAPFKCDAWCVFSDLSRERSFIPHDPKSEHSKPNAANLGGYGRRGRWAHVVLDLLNTTDPKDKTVYEGYATIELDQRKPDNFSETTYKTNYVQNFQIAPQSEKQYHFSIFCPEETWQSNINLEIRPKGRSPITRSFELSDLDQANKELIVVVSDQPGAYKYLGPQKKNPDDFLSNEKRPIEREVASVTPAELPARWHDLTVASLLIIDGPPADGLTPDQWDAVKTYAQAGGKVLVMAGRDPARLKGAVEDLCGIVVKTSTELPFIEWPMRFPVGKKEKSIAVIEVTAPGCGIVKRNSKTQIVEHCGKSYGAGMVYFLPYSLGDKMFEDWPARQTIPIGLVSGEKMLFSFEEPPENDVSLQVNPWGGRNRNYRPNAQEVSALSNFRNKLDTSFSTDTPIITHPKSTIAWFMGIYLACIVPLNYVIFFILKRREAAWLMAPLWALGFTVAAYYIGYSGQTGVVTVNEVTVLEAGPGQSNAVGRTFMGVYAPRRNDYQVEFPPENLGGGALYNTEAAPSHLINTDTYSQRDFTYPTIRIRDDGANLKIDEILIQTRSTRRFEVQHRAWINGGIDLKFARTNEEQSSTPRMMVTNNTGRALYNPVFIKGNQYLEFDAQSGRNTFEPGQQFDSASTSTGWQSINDRFFEKFSSRFNVEGNRKHVADRAGYLSAYLKTHMKQYTSGVFMAWADGASLPVKIGPTGGKTELPNIEGITLMVVPAIASNRGWRKNVIDLRPPAVSHTGQYNPELAESGNWKRFERERIGFTAPLDPQGHRSTYLKLQFDPAYAQYIYENKAAELSFSVTNRNGGPIRFSGMLDIFVRDSAAEKPSQRFKQLKVDDTRDSFLLSGASNTFKLRFNFEDSENFTTVQGVPGPSIVLRLQPVSDDGNQTAADSLVLQGVDLKIVEKK